MQAGERPMATAEGEEPQDTNAGEKKARVRGSGGTGVSLRPGEQQEAMRTSPGHLRGGGSCDSSSLAFCVIYSAYKLNKQGDNIQP